MIWQIVLMVLTLILLLISVLLVIGMIVEEENYKRKKYGIIVFTLTSFLFGYSLVSRGINTYKEYFEQDILSISQNLETEIENENSLTKLNTNAPEMIAVKPNTVVRGGVVVVRGKKERRIFISK